PPLRTRREDIPTLAAHFHERITGSTEPLPEAVVAALMTRAWPGNVRELKNVVERSACFGWAATTQGGAPRTPEATPVPVLEALVPVDLTLKDARKVWTERFESLYIAALLRRTGGNVTKAAERADVNRRYLHRLIAEHGIRGASGSEEDG